MKIHEMNTLISRETGIASNLLTSEQRHESMMRLGIDPKNFYQELEMTSSYVDTHEDSSQNIERIALHSHTFWEILYIRSGSLQYLIGTKRYHIQRGDILILPPGLSHQPLITQNLVEPYCRFVLWINADFFARLQEAFPQIDLGGKSLLRTAGNRWESLSTLFYRGVEAAKSESPLWEAECTANSVKILIALVRAFSEQGNLDPLPETQELIDEMILYIENHLDEKLSLKKTARRFLISESSVSQIFRQKLNVSFYRFVTRRRLVAAKNLILGGESLERAAGQVGFSDYSAFWRAFRQEYGISPSQFRAHFRGEA